MNTFDKGRHCNIDSNIPFTTLTAYHLVLILATFTNSDRLHKQALVFFIYIYIYIYAK